MQVEIIDYVYFRGSHRQPGDVISDATEAEADELVKLNVGKVAAPEPPPKQTKAKEKEGE
jgi:hypothetical protein